MFFQLALSLALVPLRSGSRDSPAVAPPWVRSWEGEFLRFWEQMKDLGREQRRGVGCRAKVALAVQDAHGMGSATLASSHLAVLPRHLCDELIQDRNGDGSCTGRELSSSEPPLAVGPC